MSDATVSTFAEWADYAERTAGRAQAVGDLADQIRKRLNSGRHAAVYLTEDVEAFASPCDCCGPDIEYRTRIECGDHDVYVHTGRGHDEAEFTAWLDEPRRQAEREAEHAARRHAALADEQRITTGIFAAIEAVEAEGYSSDQEWHDKLMTRLGVRGYAE
ncbi:hypothetical protein [Nocardia otitidiscaviarum]|uniref:hypothetical protein n=1 Tax=Nocardia otitidiscaviarum TaxID=1823 RepID=UPI0004A6D382|nr:hypothetical protein [Nocardia otitidiscaviarum]